MRPLPAVILCIVAGCGGGPEILLSPSGIFSIKGGAPEKTRLVVTVSGSDTPLFGETRVEGSNLIFEPRYGLEPGVTYRAVFGPVTRTFQVPRPPRGEPTVVNRITPSGDLLPENLLKFYIHFSAPMSRGEVYQRIRLVEATGGVVDRPFLQLAQELWDPEGTRLTILFDPGRIKRGLRPREEVGPPLEEGKAYALVVDRALLDASGHPLEDSFEKKFKVMAPDDVQPDPARWKILSPAGGTRDPLGVIFREPLDSEMLQRVVVVRNDEGRRVSGLINVDRGETRWQFEPSRPWRAGSYVVEVDTALEDRSGNSIGRPFEVDVFRRVRREAEARTVSVPFEVIPY